MGSLRGGNLTVLTADLLNHGKNDQSVYHTNPNNSFNNSMLAPSPREGESDGSGDSMQKLENQLRPSAPLTNESYRPSMPDSMRNPNDNQSEEMKEQEVLFKLADRRESETDNILVPKGSSGTLTPIPEENSANVTSNSMHTGKLRTYSGDSGPSEETIMQRRSENGIKSQTFINGPSSGLEFNEEFSENGTDVRKFAGSEKQLSMRSSEHEYERPIMHVIRNFDSNLMETTFHEIQIPVMKDIHIDDEAPVLFGVVDVKTPKGPLEPVFIVSLP